MSKLNRGKNLSWSVTLWHIFRHQNWIVFWNNNFVAVEFYFYFADKLFNRALTNHCNVFQVKGLTTTIGLRVCSSSGFSFKVNLLWIELNVVVVVSKLVCFANFVFNYNEQLCVKFSVCLSFSVALIVCLLVCFSIGLPIYWSVCLWICLSIYLLVYCSVYLLVCLSICLSICLFVYCSVCLLICLSVYLSACLKIKNPLIYCFANKQTLWYRLVAFHVHQWCYYISLQWFLKACLVPEHKPYTALETMILIFLFISIHFNPLPTH